MKNISITVENKRATVVGSPVIVCGNSDYAVTFAFDDEWSLTGPKTARFVYVKRGKVEHEDKVFEGNTVAVPVLSDVAFVNVGVFAGDLCTTTPARVNCKASILCSSGTVHEPTPDVYSQIMALFEEMAEKGAFGATEEQARQIEQNRQNIEQNRQSIEQQGQEIEQHGQNIEDVTGRVAELEDGTTPAGKATEADDASKLGGHAPSYFATAKSVADITDGTTPAGDANKLGGHGADEFYPKSGGRIAGDLEMQRHKNGYFRVTKNHSETADYGTQLVDYDKDGNNASLTIYSKGAAPTYKDKDGNGRTLIHNGNVADYAIVRNGSGAQTVAASSTRPIVINNTHASSSYVSIGYYLRSTKIGEIGVDNTSNPVFTNADNVGTKIHHDGNSAKVHVGTSAPSDTSAVWFDTSEL